MVHKARKLTQVNKPHKDFSKPKNKSKNISLIKIKKKITNDSKELRVLKADQQRKHSMKSNLESDFSQRGSNSSAPLLCGIFPLFDFKDIDVIYSLLKSTDPDAVINKIEVLEKSLKLNYENFIMKSKKFKKNFAFTACTDFRNRFDYLDLAKVVDWCLFILPNDLDELIGDYTDDLIAALIAQGIPSSCFITLSSNKDFKMKEEVKYFESITKINLGDEKIQCLHNVNDANKLMRHLAQNCKPSYVCSKKSTICSKSLHRKRGYFIIQHLFQDFEQAEWKITGCMRGFGVDLTTTKYIHITDIGDFAIKSVQWLSPEDSNRSSSKTSATVHIFKCDPTESVEQIHKRQDFDNESDNDEDEEEDEEYHSDDSDQCNSDDEMVSDLGSVDTDNDPADDKMSFATTAHTGYSVAQIQKFKESREHSLFPDEHEIAIGELARETLRKYHGIKGWRDTPWPIDRDLPECYAKLFQLKNYRHDRNRLLNKMNKFNRLEAPESFVRAGSLFEIVLAVPDDAVSIAERLKSIRHANPSRHLIGSNLFPTESFVSVLHAGLRRVGAADDLAVAALGEIELGANGASIECGEEAATAFEDAVGNNRIVRPSAEPLESKETTRFQVGFRRFSSTPIYSELTATADLPGSKGKARYCQFLEARKEAVATMYGPVVYGPVPVLQFRIRQNEDEDGDLGQPYVAEMVSSGSLLSIDPTRPIIKRILLTGQIYKVHKRSVMVRYMFFNSDDVETFKMVPLQTKSKKLGRIVGVHGTRGYMRCHFDKPVTQDEVAMMPLYKRVFPKYTVDEMYAYLPTAEEAERNNQTELEAMDMMF